MTATLERRDEEATDLPRRVSVVRWLPFSVGKTTICSEWIARVAATYKTHSASAMSCRA